MNAIPKLQYVTDEEGNRLFAVIPIDVWNNINTEIDQLRKSKIKLGDDKPRKKPSDFAGILDPEIAKQMLEDIERDRQDWENRL